MDPIAGMRKTGREVRGPCTDLVALKDSEGRMHHGLVFRGNHAESPLLGAGLNPVRGAMAQPSTPGLARIVAVDGAAWVYGTGTCWSLAEIVGTLADAGEMRSVRAGLELCYLVADLLLEAHEEASQVGVPCHGSLDPTRVLLRQDGQVVVVGYGLPAVDVAAWRDNPRAPLEVDALRYCPPERIAGEDEDLSSDLYVLTLMAIEVMVGSPVYDGQREDVQAQSTDGRADERIYRFGGRLPPMVQQVVGQALKPDKDARFSTVDDYLNAIHGVLSSVDAKGPSLTEVIARFRAVSARKQLEVARSTGQYTAEELAELTADLGAIDPTDVDVSRITEPGPEPEPDPEPETDEQSRWTRVQDSGSEDSSKEAARERLLKRRREAETGDARSRLRRRASQGVDSPQGAPDSPRARRRSRDQRAERQEVADSEASPNAVDVDDSPLPVPVMEPTPTEAESNSKPPEQVEDPVEDALPAVEEAPTAPVPRTTLSAAAALLAKLRGEPVEAEVDSAPSSADEATVPEVPDPPAPPIDGASTAEDTIAVMGPGGRTVSVRCGDLTAAEVAVLAAARLGHPMWSPSGQLERGFRLVDASGTEPTGPLPASARLEEVTGVARMQRITVEPSDSAIVQVLVHEAQRVSQVLAALRHEGLLVGEVADLVVEGESVQGDPHVSSLSAAEWVIRVQGE